MALLHEVSATARRHATRQLHSPRPLTDGKLDTTRMASGYLALTSRKTMWYKHDVLAHDRQRNGLTTSSYKRLSSS